VRYIDFESIMSVPRMLRYKTACANDSKKAMTLYRLNLRLSQELFTIISCFEISLRNAIDKHYAVIHGPDWLRDATQPGGMFDTPQCRVTRGVITNLLTNFGAHYSHSKLLAKMDFGFWRYLFAQPQKGSKPVPSPHGVRVNTLPTSKINCHRGSLTIN
jgi:hypothetical protein